VELNQRAKEEFGNGISREQLLNAYIRLETESKKVAESPGVTAIRGEAPKQPRKPKKKEQPAEQMRMF
jgi:hypothetical protein